MITIALHRRPTRPPLLAAVALLTLATGLLGCSVEVDDHWDDGPASGSWNRQHRHDEQGRCPTPTRCPWSPPPGKGAPDAGSPPPAVDAPPVVDAPPAVDPPPPPSMTDAGAPPVTTPPTPADGCRTDAQCGGGRCQAGACQPRCTSDATCGTGHVCRDGFCQPPSQPGIACLYSAVCGAGVCINGHCHQRCTADGTDTGGCANPADRCDRGVCRPDGRPRPQCTGNAQCQEGWLCVDAICRTPCRDDGQCGPTCSGTVCHQGFCVMPEELAPPMCPATPCAGDAGCPGVCR